ncbi:hypothetical protein Rsub_08711 [Raphidocelis subcapitata]|uniref:Uncharacterized protein n=1 Tax=Raphidocelis subcapitata TaxID=307507 RepID=A0A2V0P842_9CHLO|nr:hypothetical protein Rsub_08711 [Raphidocelis subcapitata]|eukprot:GBF95729.1 hypothetical protein Rsub_08711 [Raphidocelis subcapitata]
MAAAAMRAPDPSLLDALPPADLGAGLGPASASAAGHEDGGGDARVLRLGPVSLALASSDAQMRFKLRQASAGGAFQLSDKIRASVGAFYSKTDDRIGPTASITYMLDDRTRFEVTERRALIKRKWAWSRGNFSLGLGAECALLHTGLAPGAVRRPELHLSIDHIKPLRYEILGVGLALLANLPISLRDKELEKATLTSRLLGFTRATLKRTGYASFRLHVSELAGVLDV